MMGKEAGKLSCFPVAALSPPSTRCPRTFTCSRSTRCLPGDFFSFQPIRGLVSCWLIANYKKTCQQMKTFQQRFLSCRLLRLSPAAGFHFVALHLSFTSVHLKVCCCCCKDTPTEHIHTLSRMKAETKQEVRVGEEAAGIKMGVIDRHVVSACSAPCRLTASDVSSAHRFFCPELRPSGSLAPPPTSAAGPTR